MTDVSDPTGPGSAGIAGQPSRDGGTPVDQSGSTRPAPAIGRPRIHHHLSPSRDRALFATIGFLGAVVLTRGVTTLLHYHGAGSNGGIIIHGVHIHHLVIGIVLMLATSYLWLLLVGVEHGEHRRRRRLSRSTAIVYGAAAALILDEFALWLNLRDVYWQQQGRESLEALTGFAAFLLAAILIGPFLRALATYLRQQHGNQQT